MPNRKTSLPPIYAIFAFLYVLSAVYAMSYFFQNSALGDDYPGGATRFDAMVDGYAKKPFIYRQLVPILVRAVDRATPPSARIAVNNWVEDIKFSPDHSTLRLYMPWLGKTFPIKTTNYKRVVASIVIFAAWLGYMAGIFALGREIFPRTPAVAFFAPLFAVIAFSSFGYQWQYIYDIPCLCLSTACFYFIYTRRFRMYFLMFLLACLNKETAIFSMIFFCIWFWDKMPEKRFALLLGAQLAVYLVVKSAINISYMNNDGFFLEQNVGLVLSRDLLGAANIYKLVVVSVLWFLFTYQWQGKPDFLKRTLWILPMIYTAYCFFGFPHEYRVFFDLHAPLVLLATHTLVGATGLAKAPLFSALIFKKDAHYATNA